MYRFRFLFLLALCMTLLWVSCEEVIVLDLSNTEPRIVIEASINATAGECVVNVSKSYGFYESGELTRVTGARVELTNGAGSTIVLSEPAPGRYTAGSLILNADEHMRINVKTTDNEEYSAETRVPKPVKLVHTFFEPTLSDPRKGSSSSAYLLNATWVDPGYTFNCYRMKVIHNGVPETGMFAITSNEHFCGGTVQMPILHFSFANGDTVAFEFQSIDSVSFAFFDQINDMQMPSFVSATPYNPVGNFSNHALGYFGIYQTDKKEMIVTPGK